MLEIALLLLTQQFWAYHYIEYEREKLEERMAQEKRKRQICEASVVGKPECSVSNPELLLPKKSQ